MALDRRIVAEMQRSSDESVRNAPAPTSQLLAISLSPRYPDRRVSSNFTCRFSLRRGVQSSTMRKTNVDSHCNHKLNQCGNAFVIEMNEIIYNVCQELPRPGDNRLVFSKGAMKISVDDKARSSDRGAQLSRQNKCSQAWRFT